MPHAALIHSLPFAGFLVSHSVLCYFALFFWVVWEGEITLITAAIFTHLHIFDPWVVLAVVVLASIFKTFVGYGLGVFVNKKFPNNRTLKYFERRILYFLPRFRERPFWSIFLSKFIYGINNMTLLFAGYIRANLKMYLVAEFSSSLIWLGGMYGLGYFFARTALAISQNVRNFMLLILLFIMGFMILQKIINLVIELVEEWGNNNPVE